MRQLCHSHLKVDAFFRLLDMASYESLQVDDMALDDFVTNGSVGDSQDERGLDADAGVRYV